MIGENSWKVLSISQNLPAIMWRGNMDKFMDKYTPPPKKKKKKKSI